MVMVVRCSEFHLRQILCPTREIISCLSVNSVKCIDLKHCIRVAPTRLACRQ